MFRRKKTGGVRLNLTTDTLAPPEVLNPAQSDPAADLSSELQSLEINTEYTLELRPSNVVNIKEVGAGSGGTVIRARHTVTGRLLARKIIHHVVAGPEERRLILRELQLMKDCHAPTIVTFYGAFWDDGDISVFMEYMDLGSFDRIIGLVGHLPEHYCAQISLAVLEGVDYLYRTHKIMHRDIKPSNILFNTAGEIKICDFGVSGQLINSIANTFVGTKWYMAPERIQARDYGVQSDSWSLGLTMMELAIGRFPFPSKGSEGQGDVEPQKKLSIIELLSYIVNEKPPRLSDHPPRNADGTIDKDAPPFSQDFVDFLDACLIKDDATRPTPSMLLGTVPETGEILGHPFVQKARAARPGVDLVAWAKVISAAMAEAPSPTSCKAPPYP
ncbi:STE/STE7/MEK1 protein kinase [Fonticula alba]|uniref:STE/STE7/MEK1 protein kinase n=1 Tax=Fonticula alba TaxID=691883 RepID=A0A058ZB66_FONAL|nr:STE/STE7/MEK1 protein kinase [Fonticula alba]KCV71163.1 STE/STE7/MEK1 protein kinase [Fonticula alba]|eukprot:XP_009494286.1 STE/STE7/MEK1 protein kinase [Fonticula alba]